MSNILKMVKAKIEDASKENIKQAYEYCNQATRLLKSFSRNGNMNLVIEAMQLYSEAINTYSKIPEPFMALGYLSYQLEDYDKAIEFFKKAIDIEPFNQKPQKMLKMVENEIKSQSISKIIKKHSDKSLSEKLNTNKDKDTSKDILSQIFNIFSNKAEKKKKIASKSSKSNIINNKIDDFDNMLKQTVRIMKDND